MTSTESSFAIALKKFKTRLNKQELQDFQIASLYDVQLAIATIQFDQASRRESMNFTRLQSFLEAMTQFSNVVEVFLNTSDFLAFVWGPMKFLLQTARAWADAFDILIDAYQSIAEQIPLLERYQNLFQDDGHMRAALAIIYEDILEFHGRALRVFTKPIWRQLFRATWKDFDTTFQRLLKDLARHKALIESNADLAHYQESQEARAKARKDTEILLRAAHNTMLLEVVDWLSPTEFIRDHDAALGIREEYPGTGLWILQMDKIRAWRAADIPTHSKVWISGKPGKTVLASVIINDCRRDASSTCAYFYCKYGDPHRDNFLSVVRNILAQVLSANHDLIPAFHDRCLSSGELNLASVKLCKELLQLAFQNGKKTFVVIDGLDECEEEERKRILTCFNTISDGCNVVDPGIFRVLFVSQELSDIQKLTITAANVHLSAKDNLADIATYVKVWATKIQQKFDLDEADCALIEDQITEKSDGMFLYAKLVATNLEAQPSRKMLKQEIEPGRFPEGLRQAYVYKSRSIKLRKQSSYLPDHELLSSRLQRSPHQDLCKTLLGWMVCAKRPLMWHEIQGAISTDTVTGTVEIEERRLRVHIRDICGSLIDLLPGDRVELVHWTAKEYLANEGYVRRAEVDLGLSGLCLHYLTFQCFEPSLSDESLDSMLLKGYLTLQDYAVAHWADHLQSFLAAAPNKHSFDSKAKEELSSGISNFVENYRQDLDTDTLSEDIALSTDFFAGDDCHTSLLTLLNHIQRHELNGYESANEISITTLKKSFLRNRTKMERLALTLESKFANAELLKSFYGINWYRCSKPRCDRFYDGFVTEKQRDKHLDKHDRPFRCTFVGCLGEQIGFDTPKALEKHNKKSHPADNQIVFAKMSNAKPTVLEFKCEVCGDTFNRKFNLTNHVKSKHSDERPYICSKCGKSFGRDNDRRRHENTHAEQKRFSCAGKLKVGTWGCGASFSRLEGLKRHFTSNTGKYCLRLLWEEELGVEVEDETTKESQLRREAIMKWKAVQEEDQASEMHTAQGWTMRDPELTLKPLVNDSSQDSNLASARTGMLGSTHGQQLPPFLQPQADPWDNNFPQAVLLQYPGLDKKEHMSSGRISPAQISDSFAADSPAETDDSA